MPEFNNNLIRLLSGMFCALAMGSIARIVALRAATPELKRQRLGSLKVWWTLAVLISVAVVFGRQGASVLLAAASWLGLREFLNLVGLKRIGMPAMIGALAAVSLQYGLIAAGYTDAARLAIPAGTLILISCLRLTGGTTEGFIRATAAVHWGVMLLVYNLSHAALLFALPIDEQPLAGMAGWFLFVVIITEMDDIAQALVGRRIGKRKITPGISPNKSWEGFVGGVVTSVVLSLLLAPWLTTFPPTSTPRGLLLCIGSGLLIVTAAFLGDINMSAVKRDAGVKDGSNILPGMGGIIDRVDSLTFTAPTFYYFLRFVL